MKRFRLSLLLLSLLAVSFPVHAEGGRSRWNAAVFSGKALREIDDATKKTPSGCTKKPFSALHAVLTPNGLVRLGFNQLKERDWPAYIETAPGRMIEDSAPLYLLKGKLWHVKRGPRSSRLAQAKAAGVVTVSKGNKKQLVVTFLLPDLFGPRVYQVENDLTSNKARVRSVPLRAIQGKICGVESAALENAGAAPKEAGFAAAPKTEALSVKEIELATDCDYECYSEMGLGANGIIAGYINTINTIYEAQLGLTIKIVRQFTRSNTSTYPSTVTSAEQLLPLFQSMLPQLGAADAKHLVTGRNLDGTVVGLGYSACYDGIAGVLCLCPDYSAALTETQSALLTPIIMAHEIGHNLGASHVASGIMTAMLNSASPPQTFSTESVTQISSFVTSHGTCFATGNVSSSSSSTGGSSSSSASSDSSSSSSSAPSTPPSSSSSFLLLSYRSRGVRGAQAAKKMLSTLIVSSFIST